MADAVLSDAFDTLKPSAYDYASSIAEHSGIDNNDKPQHQLNANWHADVDDSDSDRSALQSTSDTIAEVVKRTPTASNSEDEPAASSSILPIAPLKYHRRSYDDRELPPFVSIDRAIPWYQHQSNSHRPSNNNAAPAISYVCGNGNDTTIASCNNNNLLNATAPVNEMESPQAATLTTRTPSATIVDKKNLAKMSERGFKLSTPDYDDDDSDDTPRRRSITNTAAATTSSAAAPPPVVVYRRHREHPLIVAAAARTSSATNNNKSETDSSDGERTATQRKLLTSDVKRRRGVRHADRDSIAMQSSTGWLGDFVRS